VVEYLGPPGQQGFSGKGLFEKQEGV